MNEVLTRRRLFTQAEEVIREFGGAFSLPTTHEGFLQVTALSTDLQIRNEMKRLRDICPSKKK